MGANDALVRLDLNNPVFQEHLFDLQKPERNSAIDTLRKIRLLSWDQVYRDGDFIRLLTIAPDHDSTYGRK
jgi:hypothetical protein